MADKAPALISAKKSDSLIQHFYDIGLQENTPLRDVRESLRTSKVKGLSKIAKSWKDSKLRKAMYRFFGSPHVLPVTLHRFHDNRVSIQRVDADVFATVLGILDSIDCPSAHVLESGPSSLHGVSTIVSRGDVTNQPVFDQLLASNIISTSRTMALEHERQFRSRDMYSIRELPLELAVVYYSSSSAHLQPHVDGTEGPTTILCLRCHPDDNDALQSQHRDGEWVGHHMPEGFQAMMSQHVYHRVTQVKHHRKVLVMLWCSSFS